jgi:hypothetical protein
MAATRRADTSLTPRPSRLWLWVVAAFALQAAAWTTWFILAAHHRVAEVPLESPAGIRR